MDGKRRRLRGWAAAAFAAITSLAITTAAFAGVGVVNVVRPTVTARPLPVVSLAPLAAPSELPRGTKRVPVGFTRCAILKQKNIGRGTQVPLSCFNLPPKNTNNTITRAETAGGKHYHPLAATGATIDLTAGADCGTEGALYTVGCAMSWKATNLADWSTTDTYEDYQLLPNATTATSLEATAFGSGAAPTEATTLSAQGTYAFFVYDTTAQVIVAIVYVNAGASFNIGVYQDPYHTQLSYQYNVNTSSAAYIYLPNVSTNDTYVVYIEYTSVNTFCVYLTPNGTPEPPSPSPFPTGAANSLICNPGNSPGVAAPNGQLALTWSLSDSYPAGTYSVIVYDKTQGQTMGQVQVSLTGFQQYGFILNGSPAPNPSPATPATPAAVKFAWDNATEQSTGGINSSVPNQVGGTYTMTASDPDGQVVNLITGITIPGTCTLTANTAASCTATGLFKFASASPALNPPGTYPNSIWTMQLYDPATKAVEASQAFELLGYSSETQIINGTTPGQQVTWIVDGATDVAAGLEFTNTANINYPNAADPISGIEFTTGSQASLTGAFTPPASNANGVTVIQTGSACTTYKTTGCSWTTTDSAGNVWTVYDYCSTATPKTPNTTDQCVLKLVPQGSVTLAPGQYVTVPGLTFYGTPSNENWACFPASCTGYTSILPADGLAWSNTTSTAAWTPVYFTTINSALDVTGQVTYYGSNTDPGNTLRSVAAALATAAPDAWPNSHFFPAPFAQGSYEESSPFDPGTGRRDIMVVSIAGCKGSGTPAPGCPGALTYNAGEVGITFPSYIDASEITVDPSEPKNPANTYYGLATTGNNSCLYPLPPNSICLNPGFGVGGAGGNPSNADTGIEEDDITQIWLDVPSATSSFTAQDVQLEVWNNNDNAWSQVSYAYANGVQTPVVGGGTTTTAADTLSLQAFSLNSSLMAAQFDPSTVSPGATTTSYSLTFTNTTTAADPNPDPIDAIVIEQVNSNTWTESAESVTGTGSSTWTSPSGTGYNVTGNDMEYWFTTCSNLYTIKSATWPAQAPPDPTNPGAQQATFPTECTAAEEENSIAAGGSMTFNFTLKDTTAGTQSFYVYAHGANGGGWSEPKLVQVTSSTTTASAQIFSTAAGATDASCTTSQTVAQNTSAQVSKSPNCFIYEVSNTSSAGQDISTVDISLPAFDINGASTNSGDWSLVGSPLTQYVVLGTIHAGAFTTSATYVPAGCAINAANTSDPTAGSTPGQIQVSGCTGFAPGDNVAVEFVVNTPSTESDSYLLPASINTGQTSGLAWTGSDEVGVAFSLGLAVSVDPDNPGPGNSHPVVVCNPAQCTFSGETVNFGEFGANTTITGQDVVRATVVYEGSSVAGTCPAGAGTAANTWQLQVSVSNQTTEFTTEADETNSTSGLTYSTAAGAYFSPTSTTTTLACGNYQANSDFDILQNYQVQNGADLTGHSVTVTYTLIGN